ncbi:MAG: AsmA family protein, partial [Terriglobia bacterium]
MRLRLHLRRWLLITAGVILAGWLAPPFFHAGRFRRVLQTGLERKLGRRVELGAITFRLLPHPGFSIDNVLVEEDPRFGSEPLARVGRMECDLRWRSLWRSRIDCARIFLDHPSLNIVRNARGEWNVQNFIERRSALASARRGKGPALSATFELEAQDARVNFTLDGTKKPLLLNASMVWLRFDPALGAVVFHVAASPMRTDLPLPAPGSVDVAGTWRPGRDFSGPFEIVASTRGSLLYGWIPLITGRNPEIYGLLNATVRVTGSLRDLHLDGQARLDQLHRWESLPPVGSMPVRMSFAASWNRQQHHVLIHRLDASFADSHVRVSGEMSPLPGYPRLDLVLAVERSRAENLLAMIARLTGHPPPVAASGRVDGLLTIRGPLNARQYGGYLALHSLRMEFRNAAFFAPEAGVRVSARGFTLLPARFHAEPGVECVAEGFISPPPSAAHAQSADRGSSTRSETGRPEAGRYELALSTKNASLRDLMRLVQRLGAAGLHRLDSRGTASATLRLAGNAWPFTRPQLAANIDLRNDRLLVPGLTEPLVLRHVRLEVRNRNLLAEPVAVEIGPSAFSGWVEHAGARASPW